LAFAIIGLGLAWYVHHYTSNTRLAVGVFWFFLMEFLQFFQYFFINDCSNPWNQILTFVGFVHICYQPYFTHIINSSLTRNTDLLKQYDVILRLCLVGGTMLLARYFLADFSKTPISSDFTDWAKLPNPPGSCRTTEWLRGEQLCTYRGKYHLAWSVPMYDPTYWSPAASIHSFLMFVPFFVLKWNMVIQGIFLWLAGPFIAAYLTDNLLEQASIWCFFSIAQIGIMLFLIRETLVLKWGRQTVVHSTSIHVKHTHVAKLVDSASETDDAAPAADAAPAVTPTTTATSPASGKPKGRSRSPPRKKKTN